MVFQVIEVTHVPMPYVLDMDLDVFLLAAKHYAIEYYSKTEEGRQYLKDCQRLQEKEPDENEILKEIRKQRKIK
jgi:hypothetical protein